MSDVRWRFKLLLYRAAEKHWGFGVNRYAVPIGVYLGLGSRCLSFVWRYAPRALEGSGVHASDCAISEASARHGCTCGLEGSSDEG